MRKLLGLFVVLLGFIYLSNKTAIPPIEQILNNIINQFQSIDHTNQKSMSHQIQTPTTNPSSKTNSTAANAPTETPSKYQATVIQTYKVTVENGKLIVTGKPTPYGQYNGADGVILDVQEPRANKKTTIKVPFVNQKIRYEYTLSYTVGEVILNLDEFYNGEKDDPNQVLGYANYHLTDGEPYLLPSYMVQSDNPVLISLSKNITAGKTTNEAKSRAIFEWVAKNVAYNSSLVNSDNPPLYSALDTYQNRVVLCTGYADLNAALLRSAGIEAKVVYGDNHAWNEVNINGVWRSEDPTYGSGFIDLNTNAFVRSYHPDYFTKTDKQKEGEYPW